MDNKVDMAEEQHCYLFNKCNTDNNIDINYLCMRNWCPVPSRSFPECMRSKASKQETGKFMKQLLFCPSMAKLNPCTSVSCTTFLFPCLLKARHAANLIQSGQNHIELQHLSMWLTKHFCVITALNTLYRDSFLGFPSNVIILRWCMVKYFMVKFPRKIYCILSAVTFARSTHHSNQCRQGADQCRSRDNGETSCWYFQQANSSLPGLKTSGIWFQKLSPVKPGSVFIEDLEDDALYSTFHQIHGATAKASIPRSISVMCYRILNL